MSTPTASSRVQTLSGGHVVAAPRRTDSIGGALRSAYGHQQDGAEDFTALLQRIDLADRAMGNC
jgi:hypothetical protein